MRKPHYADFLTGSVAVDFVEVISENFMIPGGKPRDVLRRVREFHPVALHGVSMSLGSADGVDVGYLHRLRALIDEIDPFVVSDHLSWTRVGPFNSHDLLPLPYTPEALDVVCDNIRLAQDVIGRTMLVENPSSYVAFDQSEMHEWEFIAAMCQRTGCQLLLDVNNIYVSATNHGYDPYDYIAGVPIEHVAQIHLAGHSSGRGLLIDTHDQPVPDPVWMLFARVIERLGPVAVMIERDDAIPSLGELLDELDTARAIVAKGAMACSRA